MHPGLDTQLRVLVGTAFFCKLEIFAGFTIYGSAIAAGVDQPSLQNLSFLRRLLLLRESLSSEADLQCNDEPGDSCGVHAVHRSAQDWLPNVPAICLSFPPTLGDEHGLGGPRATSER